MAVSWARHSLTARTLAISGVFAVLLAAGFAVLVVAIQSLRGAGEAAVRAQQAVTVGTELEKSVLNLENGLRGYVATGTRAQLAPFESARRQYPEQVRAPAGARPGRRAAARRGHAISGRDQRLRRPVGAAAARRSPVTTSRSPAA